jgi:DNA polymerase-3 subunit delta
MIIFLYGQDSYRSKEKLNEIIDGYKKIHKNGFNLRCIDADDKNESSGLGREIFEILKNETNTLSMFKEKKLIILKNSLDKLREEDRFLKHLEGIKDSDDLLLIYEEKDADQRTSAFKFFKKNAKCQQFSFLEGEKLRKWVKDELSKLKTEISPQALERLIIFVGNDLWQMTNEIKKLVNFKSGGKIEEKDVDLLVKPKIENDIFKTIDAIALRNKKLALSLIHKHLSEGDSPLYLLSMINYQFRNLLMIKDLVEKRRQYQSIAKITKIHPYVVSKSWDQVGKFTLAELKKIYRKIFEVDLAMKTGKIDQKTGLDLFIAEI